MRDEAAMRSEPKPPPRTIREWVKAILEARRDGRLSDDELEILFSSMRAVEMDADAQKAQEER